MFLVVSAFLCSSVHAAPKRQIETSVSGPEFHATASSPWTNWYKYPFVIAILKLKSMRDHLDKHNLFDFYKKLPATATCSDEQKYVRTLDGTCNDLKEPAMGSAGIRFGRNVPLEYAYPTSEEKLLSPNPREISLELFTRHEFKPISFLNMISASWIQFMIHDWFSHGENEPKNPFFLPLAANDPFQQKDMLVLRTQADKSRTSEEEHLPPSYQNEVTHWWDGSQVYGSDLATSNKLRSFKDGLLTIGDDGRLPLGSSGVEAVGFNRNWWLGLSLMHHLFVLEHNAIARELKAQHPSWDDQKLFDYARMINAAVMAKIHTVEWTPAILANPTLKKAMYSNWYGLVNGLVGQNLKKKVDPWFEKVFFKDPVLGGIVGGKRKLYGVPYTLTEEFVSVYRMHQLLPEELPIYSLASGEKITSVATGSTRDQGAHEVTHRHELKDLFYSMGISHPGALTLNNNPQFLQNLDLPIVGKTDLGAVDILRDRERGVPRYNEFRRLLDLKPIKSFSDLTDDAVVLEKLERLYGGDIEKLDLLVGCLAESQRPTGYGFGETTFQVFILMASRRLQADRFYTTDFNAKTYSKEGIEWIQKATMKSVLLRHYPELSKSLRGVKNAFNPWNP